MKNDKGEERGLKREDGLLTFFFLKRWAFIERGLKRGFTVNEIK